MSEKRVEPPKWWKQAHDMRGKTVERVECYMAGMFVAFTDGTGVMFENLGDAVFCKKVRR